MKIVIIGGVAGGASAAARARRLDENAEIVIVERGPHVSFANCGLPYFVGGEIAEKKTLLLHTPESLTVRFRLDVRVMTEATQIHSAEKRVTLRRIDSDETYSEAYDALILTMGAAPLRPRIPGIERPGHFTVRNVPDVEKIDSWIQEHAAKRAVVIGGGYIGLEMAEQLRVRGLEVELAEALPQVMAPLDPEMAAFLHQELEKRGVGLHLSDGVDRFEEPQNGSAAAASVVVLKSGTRLPADIVVLGMGVRPEVQLALDAGLKMGQTGGIWVDDGMRTSDPNIWAVGDAVEVRDVVTGQPALIPLAGPANRQGRMAAENILGGSCIYAGTFGTAVLKLFSLTAGCTGANEKRLNGAGIAFEQVHLHPGSHAGYYPGAKPIAIKILFSKETGKLLGAQAVGEDGVDKRIDVLATALQAGMTVEQIAQLELAYAPPYGSAKDPVNVAAMAAANVRSGLMETAQWRDIAKLDTDEYVILDVRDAAERERGAIPNSMHIPLNELRNRLHELPRDKQIVAHCQSGQRSYYATRILIQNGFRARNLSGSYRTWSTAISQT